MNKILTSLVALVALLLVPQAWAATYTLSGETYDPANKSGIYAAQTGISGSFTTAAPLPANLINANISSVSGGPGYVTAWSFSDGVYTYTDANSAIFRNSATSFMVTTNGTGVITNFSIILTMPATTAAVSAPAEFIFLGPNHDSAFRSPSCTILDPSGSCSSYDGGGVDYANNSGANASFAGSGGPTAPITGATSVPTLSEYGLMLLSVLIMVSMYVSHRRRG